METTTITQIKTVKDQLSSNLDSYKAYVKSQSSDLNSRQYGSENEYCINGLIGGVKNIITDISFLVKSHELFIKISTYTERQEIYQLLSNLNTYLSNKQHSNIAIGLDNLKSKLRSFNLRLDKDRYVDFNNEIDNLRRKAIQLEEEIKNAKEKVDESNNEYSEINSIKDRFKTEFEALEEMKSNYSVEIEAFSTEFGALKELSVKATQNEKIITDKLESITNSELEFEEFIKKIDDRENVLEKQAKFTVQYIEDLEKYIEERKRILEEAIELITKSKQALEYTTTESISTAFSNQYRNADKWYKKAGWLIGAGLFIIITIVLGIWILTGWHIKEPNQLSSIIGRLSLIPFTLLSALFCANQYIKQKNLIEDYAYKSVLAKSMIAFSEELREKDPEKYTEYLSTVLREIHQDPLRKRGKEKDEISAKDSVGLIDKIAELLKIVVNK